MKMKRLANMLVVLGLLLVGSVDTARALTIAGSSTGCFDCTTAGPFSSPASLGFLIFSGTNFSVMTDGSGSATLTNLGTFSRPSGTTGNGDNTVHSFVLDLTFTLPENVGGGTYTAAIPAVIGNPLDVNFDNTFHTFNFTNASGSGSFQLMVNDISSINKNSTGTITGAIRNATFTPDPSSTRVAEPASLALLGGGLAGLGAVSWRRKHR